MPTFKLTLGIFALALGLQACAVDTYFDCRNLCERYQDCIDSTTDLDRCTSRCQSNVDSGDVDQADACDSCLNDAPSCVEAVVRCTGDCAPLAL